MLTKIKNWWRLNMFVLNTAEKMEPRLPKIIEENNEIMSKISK